MALTRKVLSVFFLASLFSFSSFAVKKEKALGLMAGYSGYNNSVYTAVDFQYSLIPNIRLATDLGYSLKHDGKSAFLLEVDLQFPFKLGKGIAFYPLAGFTFNNWVYSNGEKAGRAGGNIGGGFDLYLTSSLKLQVQAKYSLMKDTSGVFAGIGINYVF